MAYSELLSNYIKNSGLTLRKISNACEELGVSVDPSYISKLQTGKMPPPSEEISRALAQVCNGDINELVTLGYIGKAPTQVQDFLNEYIKRWDALVSVVYMDAKENNAVNTTEEEFKNSLNKMPIEEQLDFIINVFQRITNAIIKSNNKDQEQVSELDKITLFSGINQPILRIPLFKLNNLKDESNSLDELGYKWVSANDIEHIAHEYFYLTVSSDFSDSDLIPPNSTLLVLSISKVNEFAFSELKNGDLVLVNYDNKYFFARYYLQDDITILQRDTKNLAPIIIKTEENNNVDIWGKIVKVEFNPNKS